MKKTINFILIGLFAFGLMLFANSEVTSGDGQSGDSCEEHKKDFPYDAEKKSKKKGEAKKQCESALMNKVLTKGVPACEAFCEAVSCETTMKIPQISCTEKDYQFWVAPRMGFVGGGWMTIREGYWKKSGYIANGDVTLKCQCRDPPDE